MLTTISTQTTDTTLVSAAKRLADQRTATRTQFRALLNTLPATQQTPSAQATARGNGDGNPNVLLEACKQRAVRVYGHTNERHGG